MGKATSKEVQAAFAEAGAKKKGAKSALDNLKLDAPPSREYMIVPLAAINTTSIPNIRRQEAAAEDGGIAPKMAELVESVRQQWVLEPILLQPVVSTVKPPKNPEVKYELIAGHRRYEASRLAGLSEIPGFVYKVRLTERYILEIQLSENVHRDDLAPTEEAAVYKRMVTTLRATHEEIALRVGKSPKHVGRYIRLLNLPEEIRERIDGGEITLAKAQFFCSLPQVVIDDMLSDGSDGWHARYLDPQYSLKEAKDKILAEYIKKLGKNLIRFDKGKAYKGTGYNKKEEWPACTMCPHKGQMELFDEHADDGEVCPFRPCLAAKNTIVKEQQEAAAKRAAAKASKAGNGGEAGKVISSKKKRSPWEIREIIRDAKEAAAAKYYAGVYFGEPPVNANELDGKEITPTDVLLVVEDIIEEYLLNDDNGEALCMAYFGKDVEELKKSGGVRELLFAAVLARIVYHGQDPHGYYEKWPGYKDAPKELLEQARRDALEAAGISEEETKGIGV